MAKILITGGTGLIGQGLTDSLIGQNHQVAVLTRNPLGVPKHILGFGWDIHKGELDIEALKWADHVVHLAGESVAGARWTPKRKKSILDSRVNSTRLLYEKILESKSSIESIISASAVGYYGTKQQKRILTEMENPGVDFLADVTARWEEEVNKFTQLGIRVACLRIGIVLDKNLGALPKMAGPVKYGVGSPLGNGKQMMPWVHIDDLVGMFGHLLFNSSLTGAFNAAAPNPVNNAEFMKTLAKTLKRPFILPAVPAFVLKVLIGEMSDIVLTGNAVSPEKIIQSGYQFTYETLRKALDEIYRSDK